MRILMHCSERKSQKMENNIIIRGISAIVKELQSMHGEVTLTRQAIEKNYELQKKTAEQISKIENHLFVNNQLTSEVSESAKKTANSALISQCELSRIALQKGKSDADR